MAKRAVRRHTPIKFPLRDGKLPDAAYSPEGRRYALVRIRCPSNPNLFYDSDNNGNHPWVSIGYTKWRIDVWRDTYGDQFINDTRQWDFFAEEIDIWEGYSDE
jgi:hypothetical protein